MSNLDKDAVNKSYVDTQTISIHGGEMFRDLQMNERRFVSANAKASVFTLKSNLFRCPERVGRRHHQLVSGIDDPFGKSSLRLVEPHFGKLPLGQPPAGDLRGLRPRQHDAACSWRHASRGRARLLPTMAGIRNAAGRLVAGQ